MGERDRSDKEGGSGNWKEESEREKLKERKRVPTVKDNFESWYNLDALGESRQSGLSGETKNELRRSRSREKGFTGQRRGGRSRRKGGERRCSRDKRSRSRDRWVAEQGVSSTSRRRKRSGKEDEEPVGGTRERTPSPSSCARLPPHLLGGWTVIPD